MKSDRLLFASRRVPGEFFSRLFSRVSGAGCNSTARVPDSSLRQNGARWDRWIMDAIGKWISAYRSYAGTVLNYSLIASDFWSRHRLTVCTIGFHGAVVFFPSGKVNIHVWQITKCFPIHDNPVFLGYTVIIIPHHHLIPLIKVVITDFQQLSTILIHVPLASSKRYAPEALAIITKRLKNKAVRSFGLMIPVLT